jgi:hypothetical protein
MQLRSRLSNTLAACVLLWSRFPPARTDGDYFRDHYRCIRSSGSRRNHNHHQQGHRRDAKRRRKCRGLI